MKTLLRLCSAAALAAALAACGEVPTVVKTESAPTRRDGVTIGGGYRTADGDTVLVNSVSSDQITITGMTCGEERGGWMGGGGHVTDGPLCE